MACYFSGPAKFFLNAMVRNKLSIHVCRCGLFSKKFLWEIGGLHLSSHPITPMRLSEQSKNMHV